MNNSRAGNGAGEGPRWARAFPELGTEPIPTDRCLSPEYFALECERVFKRVWLKVGRVEEIPNPRDFKVKRLDFANTSVLLVRGEDGRIRGFHNICSHRGNKVVWGDDTYGLRGTTRGKSFACHFHEGFRELERFVTAWSLATQNAGACAQCEFDRRA